MGLPGFQFIQDPMDYDTRTHHTNMDVYDRIQRADVLQIAAIEASFVYNAASGRRSCRASRCPSRSRRAAAEGAGGRGELAQGEGGFEECRQYAGMAAGNAAPREAAGRYSLG